MMQPAGLLENLPVNISISNTVLGMTGKSSLELGKFLTFDFSEVKVCYSSCKVRAGLTSLTHGTSNAALSLKLEPPFDVFICGVVLSFLDNRELLFLLFLGS